MTVENKNSFISLNIGVITVSDTRNKTNDKSDNLISTKKEEETLVKHNNKRNLTDEEKLEEIFKNKVMINIVG